MTHTEAIHALTECALYLPSIDWPDTQSWKWDKIATGLKDMTQALAVIFAGYFAYTRFIRGREHHESMTLSVVIEATGERQQPQEVQGQHGH